MFKFNLLNSQREPSVLRYDDQQNRLIAPFNIPIHYPDLPKHPKRYKIRILLGHKCNFNCTYCLQSKTPSSSTLPLKTLVEHIMRITDGNVEVVSFWGGEPLVYFDTIETLYTHLSDCIPNIAVGTSTNGSMLTDPRIQRFFIQRMEQNPRSGIAISYDGPGQVYRGKDPLQDPVIFEYIKKIFNHFPDQVTFNPVMTNKNYDLLAYCQQLSELFNDVPALNECVPLGVYNEKSLACVMNDEQLAIYRDVSLSIIYSELLNKWISMKEIATSLIRRLAASDASPRYICGINDPYTLVIDLNGNIIPCQTVTAADRINGESSLMGNITTMQSIKDRHSLSLAAFHTFRTQRCGSCLVRHVCSGGCPICDIHYAETNCKYNFIRGYLALHAAIFLITGCTIRSIEYCE